MNTLLDKLRGLDDCRHRAEFYRAWRAAYSAGFVHQKSLEDMGQRGSPASERARTILLAGTQQGKSVVQAIRGGGPFEEFERALLTVGEESGCLDEALRLLGDFYTHKHQLMRWVKKQMAYPFFALLAACIIAPVPLLIFGKTAFYLVAVFAGVMALVYWAGAIVARVAARYGRRPAMARARMARALATAIEAGLTLPRALRLAGDASTNPQIRSYLQRFSERDLATRSIAQVLSVCPHMTADFIAIVSTAERTGDYSPVARLAERYEDGFR